MEESDKERDKERERGRLTNNVCITGGLTGDRGPHGAHWQALVQGWLRQSAPAKMLFVRLPVSKFVGCVTMPK